MHGIRRSERALRRRQPKGERHRMNHGRGPLKLSLWERVILTREILSILAYATTILLGLLSVVSHFSQLPL
jgi:hypothetical protein